MAQFDNLREEMREANRRELVRLGHGDCESRQAAMESTIKTQRQTIDGLRSTVRLRDQDLQAKHERIGELTERIRQQEIDRAENVADLDLIPCQCREFCTQGDPCEVCRVVARIRDRFDGLAGVPQGEAVHCRSCETLLTAEEIRYYGNACNACEAAQSDALTRNG